MILHKVRLIAAVAAIFVSALACNLPGRNAPTPFEFPTPDLTLTAVFETIPTTVISQPETATIPASATVEAPQATATPLPTETQAPPAPTETATPLPSNTPQVVVDYGGPGVRSGPSMVASFLGTKPNIDGSFDDWNLDKYRLESLVAGASNWSGLADNSARVMLGWDENNLYVAARVLDDRYVQNASGENIFKGDSLEILIDTDVSGDYYLRALDGDDYQLGLSPGNPQPGDQTEAYLWFPRSRAGERTKVKIGAVLLDDGYRLEAAIPWNTFGVSPRSGSHFGFALSVSDDDKSGSEIQQSMVSYVATRLLTDPTTWGDLTLSKSSGGSSTNTRPGASLQAAAVSSAPTLDGDLSDWSGTSYTVDQVVYGAGQRTSSADLSGSLRLAWDSHNLYLGARILDQQYVQNASGKNLFLGDSLEILLDRQLGADFYVQALSPDDFQLGISPGNPQPGAHPQAYLWFPKSLAGGLSNVRIGAQSTSDGYVVEAAIPWSVFDIDPAAGDHYGFAFSISDNDNPNKDVQQSMVSTAADRILTDPTTWGELVLR